MPFYSGDKNEVASKVPWWQNLMNILLVCKAWTSITVPSVVNLTKGNCQKRVNSGARSRFQWFVTPSGSGDQNDQLLSTLVLKGQVCTYIIFIGSTGK